MHVRFSANEKGNASSQCPSSTHAHEMSSTQHHQQSTQPTTRPPAKPINDAIHYTINSTIIIYDTIIDVVHMERILIGRSLPHDNPSHCRSVLTPIPPHLSCYTASLRFVRFKHHISSRFRCEICALAPFVVQSQWIYRGPSLCWPLDDDCKVLYLSRHRMALAYDPGTSCVIIAMDTGYQVRISKERNNVLAFGL